MIHCNSHPVGLVDHWLDLFGQDATATFSIYSYRPQQVNDERKLLSVPMEKVSADWLESQLAGLPVGSEFAMHSSVSHGGCIQGHIPMVDFCAKDFDICVKAASMINNETGIVLDLFDSGRSFHGYGRSVLSHSSWEKFMALLLLINLPGNSPVIDTRWIGHRLLAGYSSLRWSANSSHYLKLPTKVS